MNKQLPGTKGNMANKISTILTSLKRPRGVFFFLATVKDQIELYVSNSKFNPNSRVHCTSSSLNGTSFGRIQVYGFFA